MREPLQKSDGDRIKIMRDWGVWDATKKVVLRQDRLKCLRTDTVDNGPLHKAK